MKSREPYVVAVNTEHAAVSLDSRDFGRRSFREGGSFGR
jgi:hypothetical protein